MNKVFVEKNSAPVSVEEGRADPEKLPSMEVSDGVLEVSIVSWEALGCVLEGKEVRGVLGDKVDEGEKGFKIGERVVIEEASG